MIAPRVLAILVTLTLALPVIISVLAAVARLLSAMGDALGGLVLDRVALATGIVWIISLIALVVVLGMRALAEPPEPPEPPEE